MADAADTTTAKQRHSRTRLTLAAAAAIIVVAGAAVGITLAVTHHHSSSSASAQAPSLALGNPPALMDVIGCDPSSVQDEGGGSDYANEVWQCTETLDGDATPVSVYIWTDPGEQAQFLNVSLQNGQEEGVYGAGWFVYDPPTAVAAAALDAGGTQLN